MAPRRRDADASGGRRREKHSWLALERYLLIHREKLAARPFVTTDGTEFVRYAADGAEFVRCVGILTCKRSVRIAVTKLMATRVSRAQLQVRSIHFNYHVTQQRDGRTRNLLRYDNSHVDTPEEYHRHLYDPRSGEQTRTILTREQFPDLAEVVDEADRLSRWT